MKNLGFTLIELIIVIGIISILSVGVLTVVNPADQIQKANDSKRKADLSQVQRALEQYYQDVGRYPDSSNYFIVGNDSEEKDWGNPWTPYMNLLPKDPSSPSKSYVYIVTEDGQFYYLYASLDRGTKDSQACTNGTCTSLPQGSQDACGVKCNYGVTSPNTNP